MLVILRLSINPVSWSKPSFVGFNSPTASDGLFLSITLVLPVKMEYVYKRLPLTYLKHLLGFDQDTGFIDNLENSIMNNNSVVNGYDYLTNSFPKETPPLDKDRICY
jgi:hypothetical protein